MPALTIENGRFMDAEKRVALLRGVNLGGSSKVPTLPADAAWNKASFYDTQHVSFIGRPFPLEEADEHFSRLKSWGLTLLRFLVTWEAIEHAGPGIYDEAYLDYVCAVLQKASEYDLSVVVDPHQDVWSRFSGGDGAPGWIFDRLGMDVTHFQRTGAAFTQQECDGPMPRMVWPSNYGKYAASTMFTLFFGGSVFAPQTSIDGVPVQEYLQGHYIRAVQQLAERLKDVPCVLGYDTLNEPSQGYIGYPDLNGYGAERASSRAMPTFYQGMLLAAGYPQRVRFKLSQASLFSSQVTLNAEGKSLWKPGFEPIWKQHGVWDVAEDGSPRLLKADYFARANFDRDFFAPFVARYTQAIRSADPKTFIFVSPIPTDVRCGPNEFSLDRPDRIVYAPHWYDGLTLTFQRYLPYIGLDMLDGKLIFALGNKRRRESFARQIGRLVKRANTSLPGAPVMVGEAGISFNMHNQRAYRTGDFSEQARAMDDTLQALEANFVNFTLWNYTADNTNSRGDGWNGEDLSIFSRDQQSGAGEPDDGGRALEAVVRPYASRIPGEPIETSFDFRSGEFSFSFRLDPALHAPLLVYLPRLHYGAGVKVEAPDGQVEVDLERQWLTYTPDTQVAEHSIRITRRV